VQECEPAQRQRLAHGSGHLTLELGTYRRDHKIGWRSQGAHAALNWEDFVYVQVHKVQLAKQTKSYMLLQRSVSPSGGCINTIKTTRDMETSLIHEELKSI
jgi:hypothetical protein